MRKAWPILALAATLAAAALPALASESSLRAETGDSTIVPVKAPTLLTRSFLVTNAAAVQRKILEYVLLPEGWRTVVGDSLFYLSPGESDLRLICTAIPAAAAPGDYLIRYFARDIEDSSGFASAEARVQVLPVMQLEIAVRDAPRSVLAGEDYKAQFEIINRSNKACPVALTIHSTSGLPVKMDLSELALAPGESRITAAEVRSEKTTMHAFTHRLTLSARIVDSDAGTRERQATAVVEIIPRPRFAGDPYHRVPSRLSARYVQAGEESGAQVELAGSGTLSAKGAYKISYRLRGPQNLERNYYGLRDEYYVTVQNKQAELRCGDLLFGLSALTEKNRLGRGVNVSYQQGRFGFGGYAMQARFGQNDLNEGAVYAAVQPDPRFSLRLNILQKNEQETDRTLFGVSSGVSLWYGIRGEIEYSAGQDLYRSARAAHAAQARFTGSWRGSDWTVEKIYATPGYAGRYRDQDHNQVTLFVPLASKLRWQGSFRMLAQNLEQDTARSAALREQQILSGLSYSLPLRIESSLDLEDFHRYDALSAAAYNYRERTASLRLRRAFRLFSINGLIRQGQSHDELLDHSAHLERYGTGFTFTPSSRQSYSASYQFGTSGSSASLRRSRILSFSATCKIIRGPLLTASYRQSSYPDQSRFESNQISFDARYTVLRRHTLLLKYRRIADEQDLLPRGTSWMLGYEVPIGMPVGRQTELGAVKGTILDVEDPTRKGLSGVVVRLDDLAALTDSKGNFSFSSVKPGSHYLQVEKPSIGFDRVTTLRVPMKLDIQGGETEMIHLGVVHGASLCGDIALYGLTSGNNEHGIFIEAGDSTAARKDSDLALDRLGSLANLEVEIRNMQEILRSVTDRSGRFSFDELRPGQWTLTVSDRNMPAFHDPEQTAYDVVISPGERKELPIRIVPRTRPVIIVDEGKVPIITDRK
ncbi:carboxypeptidase regulatory-like domain-containing protein [candidate division KSB1 bacterium]|nr:MAG: carboxypeptidase regulatory-like domain-containing protein [candidate division KSB1 bacterium]